MNYQQTIEKIKAIKSLKTNDIDAIAKEYVKSGASVDDLYPHLSESGAILRIYFFVSLKRIKSLKEQILFIERHFAYLQEWWHVDILLQFLIKPLSFDYIYPRAQWYVISDLPFVRRWGYVIFLSGLQKDPQHCQRILALMHDDDHYYVQMAEAWLIADLCAFSPREVVLFLKKRSLQYNIAGKAIQKIVESFKISDETKAECKEVRAAYRE